MTMADANKTGPLTLEGLISWLATMPADKNYDWMDIHECLLAQYFKAGGYKFVSCYGNEFSYYKKAKWWWFASFTSERFSSDFIDIAANYPRTFGGALDRATAAKAKYGRVTVSPKQSNPDLDHPGSGPPVYGKKEDLVQGTTADASPSNGHPGTESTNGERQ